VKNTVYVYMLGELVDKIKRIGVNGNAFAVAVTD
jgi:hypothetical protein